MDISFKKVENQEINTLYLIRHSKPDRKIQKEPNEDKQSQNEAVPLSKEGKEIMKLWMENLQLPKPQIILSSSYQRAKETGEFFSQRYQLPLIVDERVGERKLGKDDILDLWSLQFQDWNKKPTDGESLIEVQERMWEGISSYLQYPNLFVISHGFAITAFLMKWAQLKDFDSLTKKRTFLFQENCFFDDVLGFPDGFCIRFKRRIPFSIERIKLFPITDIGANSRE